jgi:hypothetical protein
MTEDGRPPAADIIDVFVTIDVLDTGAVGALDEKRLTTDIAKRTHGRIHSARNALLRA